MCIIDRFCCIIIISSSFSAGGIKPKVVVWVNASCHDFGIFATSLTIAAIHINCKLYCGFCIEKLSIFKLYNS